jgi:hypothetical protein
MCMHVGFFQLYVHDFYSTWNTYYSTWMGMLRYVLNQGCISNLFKQEINNHGTCLTKPLHTKQQQNVWRTIGPPSMRLLSDLPKICPLRSDEFKKLWLIDGCLVFNTTFSNISAISWRPVLVVEEARVSGENHRPWASNW